RWLERAAFFHAEDLRFLKFQIPAADRAIPHALADASTVVASLRFMFVRQKIYRCKRDQAPHRSRTALSRSGPDAAASTGASARGSRGRRANPRPNDSLVGQGADRSWTQCPSRRRRAWP